MVLLPGAYDKPEDFVRNGFISALRERHIAADVIVPDTHFGYYSAGVVENRLHRDIILPARQKNYSQIWLAGISLGGYGSMLYAQQHGELVDGVFLMAPFLGNRSLIAEIAEAGGVQAWQPGRIEAKDADDPRWFEDKDYDRRFWSWLKSYQARRIENAKHLQIRLGYGTEDRFASSNRLLGTLLPADHVKTVPGGHEWGPWKALWTDFLDRSNFPKCNDALFVESTMSKQP
ncbi:alpha/beta hydrolase-fold protein [Oxalobacteraceae bacterium R-40]|uniref:Alpha/beta hydrolase-fold protein n=1 Tax=Keguizhuia sedimenti TaxID=3064264 RepID=A0ABU1BS58_9BURK|nr:alpha/beta hydrolase-fold protein [Oxalobacteraceae bacterium R-40]